MFVPVYIYLYTYVYLCCMEYVYVKKCVKMENKLCMSLSAHARIFLASSQMILYVPFEIQCLLVTDFFKNLHSFLIAVLTFLFTEAKVFFLFTFSVVREVDTLTSSPLPFKSQLLMI